MNKKEQREYYKYLEEKMEQIAHILKQIREQNETS